MVWDLNGNNNGDGAAVRDFHQYSGAAAKQVRISGANPGG